MLRGDRTRTPRCAASLESTPPIRRPRHVVGRHCAPTHTPDPKSSTRLPPSGCPGSYVRRLGRPQELLRHDRRGYPGTRRPVVRCVGEPVAIVAAEDPVVARRAVAAIEVDYDSARGTGSGGALERRLRVSAREVQTRRPGCSGEVQAEGEYVTPRQDHAFLAPDAGIARPDGRGGVEIIGAAQWVHADRLQIAAALGPPEELVLVRQQRVGGSFGGRVSIIWQLHGALLALHTGRPVKPSIAGKRPCWPAITGTLADLAAAPRNSRWSSFKLEARSSPRTGCTSMPRERASATVAR